jgi:CheY-like chemotaxis protein
VSDSEERRAARDTMRRFQHEVRTPIGQIMGYSELLEEELEDRGQEDLKPDLARIRGAAQRLLDLVDGKLRSEVGPAAPAAGGTDGRAAGGEGGVESTGDARASEAGAKGDGADAPHVEPAAAPQHSARILVVDDDPHNRDLLARRLERQGFETEMASDGIDALRRIDSEEFDLVMLDVMMPGMNGLEVLERVRRTRSLSALPVILATGLADSEDAVEGLSRGANDYVTKPFEFPMVIARVRTQLAASRSSRKLATLARQLEFRNSFIREALGSEISTDMLVELAETPDALELGNESRVVSAVVADVQGSRKLAAETSPARFLTVLRNTLGGLAAVVADYGGAVDAMVGDSLVATFGLPEPAEGDTARAAACALAMQLEMQEINERNATAQLPRVEIAVGMATGDVVVGGFGHGDSMRFRAIGEPFLDAARIEAEAQNGEVWICRASRERLGGLAEVDLERELSGVPAHRLLGVGGEWLMSLRAVPGATSQD